MKFEESMKKIDDISKQLDENVSLEEGLKLFENSLQLAEDCMKQLNEAKGKITEISLKLGQITETDFNV